MTIVVKIVPRVAVSLFPLVGHIPQMLPVLFDASSRLLGSRHRGSHKIGERQFIVLRLLKHHVPAFSSPVVKGRISFVQHIVADQVILPPHGVMQRMRAGIAPVPIEVEACASTARAAKLEQLG
ncbi:hypothetical protein ACVIGB_005300 [Bradyrhizobium sp. USDA 4341]